MTDSRHYRAFISYSHSDEAWARWLQRALEGYRLPKSLRQSHPELPARLYPIFRDRDELASAHNLTDSIRQAMDDSDALIVICSPAARASRWVNEEIHRFRAGERGQRIFCLMVAGSPDPDAVDCAFPDALLRDDDGSTRHEPLAADVSPGGDGKRNAMLKIAAGLLNVGVDDLKRRDAQRQARFWSVMAFGSLFIAALTIGLALYALNAKRESEIRRSQAENLIGFMLGDLRKNLEPIGKLELLDSVGDQAMAYFAAIGEKGTEKEMLERAKALKQIGDVRFNQGELEPALKAFRQALTQTKVLHESNPANNDYLFELGQAEFWVGNVAWQRGDLKQAETTLQNYMQYSRELLARDPSNSDYNMELSYAYSNLGSLARARGNSQVALQNFILSADINAVEMKKVPGDMDLIFSYAEGLSWIGSTKADLGDLNGSEQAFAEISALLQPIYKKAETAKLTYTLAANMVFQAEAKLYLGDIQAAKEINAKSLNILSMLVSKDPQNAMWLDTYNKSVLHKLSLISASDWSISDDAELNQLQVRTRKLSEQDPSNSQYTIRLASIHREKALRALHAGAFADAVASAKSAHVLMQGIVKKSDSSPLLIAGLAKSSEVLGSALMASHQAEAAELIWNDAAALLDKQSIRVFDFYPIRYLLAIDLKQTEKAKEIERKLLQAGFKDPRMHPAHTQSGTLR